MRDSAATIDALAAAWVVRIDRGLTGSEQADLHSWLAKNSRHRGALARAQAVWLHAGRAQALRAAREVQPPPERRCRTGIRWSAAAVITLSVLLSFLTWQAYSRTHLATAKGEIRKHSLEDGSYVTLDTRTKISVQFEPTARILRLESGEALFEVAKDSNRPFVVQAGDVRVRAIGTAFVVRRNSENEVEVTVTKGIVSVWHETRNPERVIRLVAGDRTVVTPQQISLPLALTKRDLAHAIVWKSGIIDLDNRTLRDAAAEFNRYNRQIVVIADARLAEQKVVGRFQATDPLAFVSAAAAMLDAHVRRDSERLVLEPGTAP